MIELETALLKKILDTGDFDTVLKAGINATFFSDPKCQAAFTLMLGTYQAKDTWGLVPSIRQIAPVLPEINIVQASQENMPILIRDLRNSFVVRQLSRVQQHLGSYLNQGRAEEAILYLQSMILEFQQRTKKTRDLTFGENYHDIIDIYDTVRNKKGLTGIPWPWDKMNEETLGIQKGEYIVFTARPKNMKTWLLCYLAHFMYSAHRRRVLFYTREMSPETILRRMVALAGKADYSKFTKATLTEQEELDVWRRIQSVAEVEKLLDDRGTRAMLRITDCSDQGYGSGVAGLRRKIEDTQPDIVFIDAVYLMTDDQKKSNTQDWLQHTHVSRDIRNLSHELMIPIVVTTQVKREGEKTHGASIGESALTDAFGQDGELIVRINLQKATEDIVLVVSGSREVNLDGFVINAKPAYDFSFKTAELPQFYRKLLDLDGGVTNPNAPPSQTTRPPGPAPSKAEARAQLANNAQPGIPEGAPPPPDTQAPLTKQDKKDVAKKVAQAARTVRQVF